MQEINLKMGCINEGLPFYFYWNPRIIGETITGHVFMIGSDEYGAESILLKIEEPFCDIHYLIWIPPHPSIMSCYCNLDIGDYMKIQYVDNVHHVGKPDEKIFNIEVNCNK